LLVIDVISQFALDVNDGVEKLCSLVSIRVMWVLCLELLLSLCHVFQYALCYRSLPVSHAHVHKKTNFKMIKRFVPREIFGVTQHFVYIALITLHCQKVPVKETLLELISDKSDCDFIKKDLIFVEQVKGELMAGVLRELGAFLFEVVALPCPHALNEVLKPLCRAPALLLRERYILRAKLHLF
jgi:hypothetical protein